MEPIIDLTLPDTNWNGEYMAEGGGVYAGTNSPATDQLAAELAENHAGLPIGR